MQGLETRRGVLQFLKKNKTLYRFMKIKGIKILTLSLAASTMHSTQS
jgi:hypothetical protein